MEAQESERVIVEVLGTRIREGVRQILVIADALALSEGREGLHRIVVRILTELEDVEKGIEPRKLRVPCPACRGAVMPKATLCGFCWGKLIPAPTAT